MELPQPYRYRVDSPRRLIEVLDDEIDIAESQVRKRLRGHRGYGAIQAFQGVGPVMAAILVAEMADVSRFVSTRQFVRVDALSPRARRQGRP